MGQDFAILEALYTVVRIIQKYPTVVLPQNKPDGPTGDEKRTLTLLALSGDGGRVLGKKIDGKIEEKELIKRNPDLGPTKSCRQRGVLTTCFSTLAPLRIFLFSKMLFFSLHPQTSPGLTYRHRTLVGLERTGYVDTCIASRTRQ